MIKKLYFIYDSEDYKNKTVKLGKIRILVVKKDKLCYICIESRRIYEKEK